MTDAHVIPQSVGGRLSASFLCKACNDEMGRAESFLPRDISVRLQADAIREQLPRELVNIGGAAGGTSTGSGEAAAVLALVGAVVGAVVGSFIASVKVVYEAHWTPTGWQLVALQPAPAAPPLLGFA